MISKFTIFFVCVIPSLAQVPVPVNAPMGTVSGILTGEDGSVVPGISVSLHRSGASIGRKPRQMDFSVASGKGGAFQFAGLEDGNYSLCIQPSRTTWLDPCEWGFPSTSVALTAKNRNPNITFRLKRGVAVPIRVDDTAQSLAQNEGKTAGAHLLIGFTNRFFAFRSAFVVSKDGTGRTHQIVVPFDTEVRLVVASSFFQLKDNLGTPIPKEGKEISILVPAGKIPPSINLTVASGGRL